MDLAKLDFLFPFFVFSYGVLLVFVNQSQSLKKLLKNRPNPAWEQLKAHDPLAWICFWVGGLWSLQNLMFGSF